MRSKPLSLIIVFVLISFSFGLTTNATVVKILTDEDLVNYANIIMTGTVTDIRSEWNEQKTKIFTYITITPQNFLKGDNTHSKEIVIKQIGGEVGDIGMRVEGVSVFQEGEEVFLFLTDGRGGFKRIVGLSQGKFSIKSDPNTKRKFLVKERFKKIRTRKGKFETIMLEIQSDKRLFLDEFSDRVQAVLDKSSN